MFEICKLTKSYKKRNVLDKISFLVDEGSIFGVFGKSNNDNSILTKIAAGIMKPSRGKLIIDGIDVYKNLNITRKIIGYVPDRFGRYDNLKVEEYFEYYANLYNLKKSDKEINIKRLLSIVKFDGLLDKFVDELSRDERKRLCIGRSLIHNPKIIIFDNPFYGLDKDSSSEINEIIKNIHSLGKTIIISGDNFSKLTKICTSAGVLDNGKMYLQGSITDVMMELFNKGKNIVRVDISKNLNELIKILQDSKDVEGLTVSNDYIDFVYKGTDENLSKFLKELIKNDIEITSFSKLKNIKKS